MFLELIWNRIDTLIASFLFTQSEIAAQVTWMNIVMIMDCFSYGFAVSISSKISFFIVKEEISNAKKSAMIAIGTVFSLGVIFGLILWGFGPSIAY